MCTFNQSYSSISSWVFIQAVLLESYPINLLCHCTASYPLYTLFSVLFPPSSCHPGDFLIVLPQPLVIKYPLSHVVRKHHGSQLHGQKKCNIHRTNTQNSAKALGKLSQTLAQLLQHRHAQSARQKSKHSCNRHLHARSLPKGVKLLRTYRIRYVALTGVNLRTYGCHTGVCA